LGNFGWVRVGQMARSVRFVVSLCATLVVVGCATITKGTTQAVSVTTPGGTGAQCTLTSPAIGTKVVQSPGTLVIEKGRDGIAVNCKKECYPDGVGVIASNVEEMAAGNIIAGGVIGLGIDAASGAMNKYNTENQFAMSPIPGCRAKA
jgi:hypothetical protein